MRNLITVASLLLLLTACGTPKEGQLVESDNDTIDRRTATAELILKRFSDGATTLSHTSVAYEPFVLMLTDLPTEAVLQVQHIYHPSAPDTMMLTTFRIEEERLLEQSAIILPGAHYQFVDNARNLLQVTTSQPEEGLPTHQLVNLIDGTVICRYTQALATLTLPTNAVKRYAGFHSANSTVPLHNNEAFQGWTGVLTYARQGGTIAAIAIKSYDSRLFEKIRQFPPDIFFIVERGGNEIRTRDLELFPEAGQTPPTIPTDFAIEINFGKIRELENIRIPVVNDALQLPTLTDTRLALEVISPE